MGASQRGLGLLALGDVHRDPDGALRRVGRVDGFAAHFANDGGAVLAAQLHLAFVGDACGQGWIAALADFFPRFIAGIPSRVHA